MRALAPVALLALLSSTSVGAEPKKVGQKQSPPACGAKILPMVTGNIWTYEAVAAPEPILPELAKLAPRQPRKIVITVKSVAPKGTETVVTLEEKLEYEIVAENKEKKKPAVMQDVTVNTSITCGKGKFEISPDSFFFAGEPGGFRGLELDKLERSKDTGLKLTPLGSIGDDAWREDIVAHFVRKPAGGADAKISAGKLEMERSFTPAQPEDVNTRSGLRFPKAEKLQLITTGRITLDAPVAPTPTTLELPKNWRTLMWFAVDTGVVKTLNMYAHMYTLVDTTMK
jgi:hypothetical protein